MYAPGQTDGIARADLETNGSCAVCFPLVPLQPFERRLCFREVGLDYRREAAAILIGHMLTNTVSNPYTVVRGSAGTSLYRIDLKKKISSLYVVLFFI